MITHSRCRVCDSPLVPILNLGDHAIAGGFGDSAIKRKVPLELMRCDTSVQGACGLVQLKHTVPGPILYSSYFYRSGTNQTMTDNLHEIAQEAQHLAALLASCLVIDVGCNDGTLLDGYTTPNLGKLGFDPSDIAEHAWRPGDAHRRIVQDFFSWQALDRVDARKAKAITSIAMFYDLEDPRSFVADIKKALALDGIWVVEMHYLPAMLESNGFDAIVHEHLGYYSLSVLERLFAEQGLEVVKASTNGMNGGSIRLFVGHRGQRKPHAEWQAELRRFRIAEFEMGLDTFWPYEGFAQRVSSAGHDLQTLCIDLVNEGKRIHVYGASTKGNTILAYSGRGILGPRVIEMAADRNPEKWGTTTVTGIPIVSEEESRAANPDYYLVLPWHFLDEFVEREREFLERGGKFIVPLPEVRIIGVEDLAMAA